MNHSMTVDRKASQSSPCQNGFVLIVVLGAILMLSVLLFGFHRVTRMRLDAANSLCQVEQAANCARAGLQIVTAAVADTNDLCGDKRFAKLTANDGAIPLAGGTCSIKVTEESGLLNVNRLKSETGELHRKQIDQLLRLIDLLNRYHPDIERIGYGIVPAIIDWIDRDNDITHLPFVKRENMGAEEGYYTARNPPYHCRNSPADAIDELLSVKGMTREALGLLRESLTTFGDGKIDINAAPKQILECLCEQMSPALAQMIVNQRRLRPFRTVVELKDVPGMTDNVYRSMGETITVSPAQRHYRVISRGTVDDHSFTVEAVLRRNTQAGNVDMILYKEL
jgi:general secretion pathway protein K